MITNINEFRKIFENKTNKKLILYHGTNNEFNEFNLKLFNVGSGDGGWLGYGIYLTNNYDYAKSYGKVLKCEVTLNNLYLLEDSEYSRRPNRLNNELNVYNSRDATKKLKEMGYDSVMLKYADDTEETGTFIEVCVFNSQNIKIIK